MGLVEVMWLFIRCASVLIPKRSFVHSQDRLDDPFNIRHASRSVKCSVQLDHWACQVGGIFFHDGRP
jgi:hypothetical protein